MRVIQHFCIYHYMRNLMVFNLHTSPKGLCCPVSN